MLIRSDSVPLSVLSSEKDLRLHIKLCIMVSLRAESGSVRKTSVTTIFRRKHYYEFYRGSIDRQWDTAYGHLHGCDRGYFLFPASSSSEERTEEKVGDSVVTTSGFYGVILDVTEEDVIVEFGNNKNCRIPMRKTAIAEVEKADAAVETKADTDKDKKSVDLKKK